MPREGDAFLTRGLEVGGGGGGGGERGAITDKRELYDSEQ